LDRLVSAPPSARQHAHLKAIAPLGGLTRSKLYDAREMTAKARATFRSSFEREVDPDGTLARDDPDELQRRVAAARRLHFARMAYQSHKARRAGKAPKLSPSDLRSGAADRPETAPATHDEASKSGSRSGESDGLPESAPAQAVP
jgi:hypothetical protein